MNSGMIRIIFLVGLEGNMSLLLKYKRILNNLYDFRYMCVYVRFKSWSSIPCEYIDHFAMDLVILIAR